MRKFFSYLHFYLIFSKIDKDYWNFFASTFFAIFSQLHLSLGKATKANELSPGKTTADKLIDAAAITGFLLLSIVIHNAYLGWNFDDSYIVYRIVDNILNGHGWVYNPGEYYNASTSVLNTVAVTVVAFFIGDVSDSAHLIGSISIFLCTVLVYDLLREGNGAVTGMAGGILVAALLANNQTWGLESHLFAALVLAFVWMEKQELNSWFLLGLIFLARPDGILFFGMKLFVNFYRTRRLPIKGPLLSLLVVLPWLVFSLTYFGQLMPETLGNKIWQGQSGFWGTGAVYFTGLKNHINELGFWLWPLLVLGATGTTLLLYRKDPVCYLLAFALFQQLFYSVINVPAYHWYFSMLDLGFCLSCVYGASILLGLRRLKILDTAILLAIAYLNLKPIVSLSQTDFTEGRDQSYHSLSQRIDELGIAPGSLAALEVGTIGYLQNRQIIDLVSLTSDNPEFLSGRNIDEFFVLAPKIVVLHDPIWSMEQTLFEDPRFLALYDQKSTVAATVATKVFVRKVDSQQQIARILEDTNSDLVISIKAFTGYSDGQRCTLDSINGAEAIPNSNWLWSEEIDSMVFVGWMFDTAEQTQPLISLGLIDKNNRLLTFETATIYRPDLVVAFGKESYANSGFHSNLRQRLLEAGEYHLAAVHPATNRICDLHVTLEIKK